MKLYNVTDREFSTYGRVLELDSAEIIAAARALPLPAEGSAYTASEQSLEQTAIVETLRDECYGEMPIQAGFCCGHSDRLNALEWHKSPEINIAVTDMILFLGRTEEFENGRYQAEKVKAFLLKAGQSIEVFAETLHFCPCETTPAGFGCIVILPKGTNLPLEHTPADQRLFRKNKWLIAHNENQGLIERGVVAGIDGINIRVEDL